MISWEIFWNSVTASGVVAAISAGIFWLARNSIQSWFWKEHSKEIEQYKADLQITTEKLKFELQRTASRSQLFSSSIFSIYPEIYQQIKMTIGSVEGLYGATFPLSFEQWNADDFREHLKERNFPSGSIQNYIGSIESNREKGIEKLKKQLRSADFHVAFKNVVELKNLFLLKELLVSKGVAEYCWKIHAFVNSGYQNSERTRTDPHGDSLSKAKSSLIEAERLTSELMLLMHKELNP